VYLDFLVGVFKNQSGKPAIIWKDQPYSYDWLLDRFFCWGETLRKERIAHGAVTIIEGDYSPSSIALFLALIEHGCVLVPLTKSVETKKDEFTEICQGEYGIAIREDDSFQITRLPYTADHEYYAILRQRQHPGLVLFSSGSSGKSKAAVHDFTTLLKKFTLPKRTLTTITFLLYDHIGGVNTLLYTLSNGGTLVTVADRSPEGILSAVEKHQVELLPTSPTFINLVLLSGVHTKFDLRSLKRVTYGTEPMPETTLKRFHELYPNITLQQTYGLSELGILRSKSEDSASLWVKIGGEGFQTRVVDGILQIKAESTMLGYLNAPNPFTDDGWFDTDDEVEVKGEYFRILGRRTEIINVGGQKVYPTEVESTILEMDGIRDVLVYGEKNPIMGNIVCALVSVGEGIDEKALAKLVKRHCASRLQAFKVPVKISFTMDEQFSARFKKDRKKVN
jgi:long-chain acyl-CoA synthetase